MADNVPITAGSGTNMATDQVATGEHYQKMKLFDGTADSVNAAVVDSSGRLQAAVAGTSLTSSSATLSTTASPPTAVGSNTAGIVINTALAGNVTLVLAGTYTGSPVVAFEVSNDGGTTWVPWQGVPAHTRGAMATGTTLAAGTPQAWEFALPGILLFRVRLTTAPASNTVAVALQSGSWVYDPIPSAEPKDSGRTPLHYYTEAYSITASEALATITGVNRGGTVTTTQLTVAAGKTLRVQSININAVLLGTTVTNSTIRLRANLAGAALVSSPIYWECRLGNQSIGTQAANYAVAPVDVSFPDGLEFPAGAGIQLTAVASTAAMHSLTASLVGYEY